MKTASLLQAVLAAFFLCVQNSSAQEINYPESVIDLFEKTDAACLPHKLDVPLIAVPQCASTDALVLSVQKTGAAAIIVPETSDGAMLREIAAFWDGAAIPDGWVKEESSFSILFYKAVADRNIPHTGTSVLSEEIDQGLMRYDKALPEMERLYRKSLLFKRAKDLMDRILSIDAHGDLPCCYDEGRELGLRQNNQISLQKMEEGHLSSRVLISYLGQKGLDDESSRKAFAKCDGTIDAILADIAKNSRWCGLARTEEDAIRLKARGKKAFFLGIENGYGIGNDINNVKHYADRGVIYITLSHLYDNAICHSSSHSADTTLGLTAFGRDVVRQMNHHGIMVDVSHTSSGTFWDCIKYSEAPIICSHSGAMAVYRHNRNLTDSQLRALAAKGGLVMVYIVPNYMADKPQWGKVSIDNMMEHLLHCIAVAGIDHVGISCDLDGGGGGWGVNGDNDVINVTVRLLEAGFSDSDIEKIWSGNFFRVLREVQAAAHSSY
ncbi:MAG: membrane dipeptidase [Bacteroidales bacterium]|nr:membrane dipeptidase [Bacteroidales bacterium]